MTLSSSLLKSFQGYRRSIHIVSNAHNRAWAELEDDIHAFMVGVNHDGQRIVSIDVDIRRAPWSTCPGAEQVLKNGLQDALLEDVRKYPEKTQQCTHLLDLATWSVGYAKSRVDIRYDIFVHDAVQNVRHAEIWRDGEKLIEWDESKFVLQPPHDAAGLNLFQINDWIKTLSADKQEAVRMLRWGNMIANGRAMTLEAQSDATKMPPNCYSFQPERAVNAKRVGEIKDFSFGKIVPLE